jgi:outer membrane protein assembly factor BamB
LVAVIVAGACLAVLPQPSALGQPAAGPLLGAANFTPSAERPVGWRGDGTGRFPGATPPTTWERKRAGAGYATKGIVWAAPLPNGGLSSPIVAGGRIFVTVEPDNLVCLDKQSGKILWIRSNQEFEGLTDEERKAEPAFAEKLAPLAADLEKANAAAVEALNAQLPTAATAGYSVPQAVTKKRDIEKQIQDQLNAIDKKRFDHSWPQGIYGYCTETPASDGKSVCAFFATGIAACYDMDGKRKWIARGSNGGEEKGHYSSPLLMGGQFVVWGDPEMRGYDVATGKVVWRNAAKGSNCGSLFRIQVGKDLVAGVQTTCFTRVGDGQTVWKSGTMDYSFTTPIVEGGVIYFWTAGGPTNNKDFKAFKIPAATDTGKVTPALTFKKADWAADELTGKFDKGDINASPLFVDGLIYHLYPGGGLLVHDAATGDIAYRKVLPMKPRVEYWAMGGASASPALAGKYIYLLDNQGTTVVIQPGRQYKEVAVNRIEEVIEGSAQDQNLATPVFEGARMYCRTPGYLYCIGEK